MDNGGEGALPVDHVEGQPPNFNISDVIEAICNDPLYGAGVEMPRAAPHPGHPPGHPQVRIAEQPAGKALRFRYECEGRSAGSIPGVNSTPERKTYPTIEIVGHKGQVVIVVSCVTREEPYKPHPHNLVGRERCENGVCTLKTTITEENPQVSFSNLGIQCVKRKDITDALKTREKLRVDPFKTGYNHRNQPQSIDLNAVRLCFQVFIPDERTGKIRQSLQPVVSDVIYDKKAMSDLAITRLSQCTDYSTGGAEIILLCEKVTREDIAIVFFEQDGEHVVWEEYANIVLVHKLTAIVFHVPPYRDANVPHHVKVYLQLKRTSDNARSNVMYFEYIPKSQDPSFLKRKRQKTFSPTLQMYEQDRFANDPIKAEPRDKTPPHQMSSPRQQFSPPYEAPVQETSYQWEIPPSISMAGPSHMAYGQDLLQWNQNYMQLSPNMQSVSPNLPMSSMTNLQNIQPNLQSLSPNVQSLSPNVQSLSPNVHAMSPNVHAMSPNVHAMSPNVHAMSPNVHAMSPNVHSMSPNVHSMSPNVYAMAGVGGMGAVGRISPMHGGVSPNMGHISPNMMQQTIPQQDLMETVSAGDSTSIIGLLQDRGEAMSQLNSGELSGLSSLLDRGPDLSDSLNRLSTSDLVQ